MVLTLGIDEAGRGPLIGPMILAGVVVDESGAENLRSLGVKDSKLLLHGKRVMLYEKIVSAARKFRIISIPPREIDEALNSKSMNLNRLEARACAEIINELRPDKAIIDCPSSNPAEYTAYLKGLLDDQNVQLVVEHKADVNYVECAAASILAKVTREQEIEKIKKEKGDFGSGYPSDPKTVRFLDENYGRHPEIFRRTWATYKKRAGVKGQKTFKDYRGEKHG